MKVVVFIVLWSSCHVLGLKKFFYKINSLKRQAISKGLVHLFSANCITQFVGFGSILVVSKFLTPSELGAIKIIQSYVIVCVCVASLGYNSAILKFCAMDIDEYSRLYILKSSFIKVFFFSIFVTICLLIFTENNYLSHDFNVKSYLPIYSVMILFSSIYELLLSYIQARKKFKQMAKIQVIIKIISAFIIIIATYSIGVLGYISMLIIIMLISVLFLIRVVGGKFLLAKRCTMPGGFHFMARMSFVGSILSIIGQYIDIFFLDYYILNREEVGCYALATIFLLIATQFYGTVQNFLIPYFSEHFSDGTWLWHSIKKYQSYLLLGMFIVCVFTIVVGWLLVSFFYGEEYNIVIYILFGLLLQVFFRSCYAVPAIAILSLNKVHYNAAVAMVYLFVKVFLCYMLINEYGIWGIVMAQVVTEMLAVILEYTMTYSVFCRIFGRGKFS